MKKYESISQPGAYYWAEKTIDKLNDHWAVISKVEGYPATEAWDDWFMREEDADDIARRLANDEDLWAETQSVTIQTT